MANWSPYPGTDDGGVGLTADRRPGAPRWVKVFGIIAALVVLLLVVMLLAGHGPGRHVGSHAPPSSVAEHGVQRS